MRRVLGLLATRYGIAGVLAFLLLAVLLVAKLGSGNSPGTLFGGQRGEPSGASPTGRNDGVAEPGPSGTGPRPLPTAVPPGIADPRPAALAFADAWLAHSGVTAEQWRARLAPLATPELQARLADADPTRVPANRVAGDAELLTLTDIAPTAAATTPMPAPTTNRGFADVRIPLDAGRLRLGLVLRNTTWLADTLDWERS